ncbi:MAG: hypothetical protein JWO15_3608 [Sphingomonadales bacterium]|nr:hypothetical protein [Sphingomonadales bacterium]
MSHPLIYTPTPIIKPEDVTIDTLKRLSENSFPLWCLSTGAQVDGHPVDFDNHRYLLPIYLDNSVNICWQKAAQLGATSYMLLRMLWFLEQNQGTKGIIYFPTQEGAQNLSSDRLDPIIESCPSVAAIHDKGSKLSLRRFGKSALYILHLGGSASKDSVPADILAFDEVRLVAPKDVDQAQERIAHSSYKYRMFMSTCGYAGDTIAARFNRGTQHIWMSKCGCSDGCDLARTFPDCVVNDPKRGVYLRCPKCKYTISDPQNGRYVAHNPGADYNSYHASQLNSKFITLKEIWDSFKHTTNLSEFYNAKLGLPYTDESNRGVSQDQLQACVNTELQWPGKMTSRCAMGVDVGGTYLAVTIMDIHPNGNKKRLRHVEFIERGNRRYFDINGKAQDLFVRLHELMKEFNVQICVIDAMPDTNGALNFAQTYPGRVYLAYYQQTQKEVVVWTDKIKTKEGVKKAGPKFKFKYYALISRLQGIGATLGDFAAGNFEVPNPDWLIQNVKNEQTGVIEPEAICRRLFDHMTRLIREFKEVNPDTGEGKWNWIYTGGDPHLAHSAVYCNMALERLRRIPLFTFG